jgi:hypothetical protein
VIHSCCDFGPAGRSIKSTGWATSPLGFRGQKWAQCVDVTYDKTVSLSWTLWSRVESLAYGPYSDRLDAAYEHDKLISQFA